MNEEAGNRKDPSPHDTAEISCEEIHWRLELGRLGVEATTDGSRLVVTHAKAPEGDRRQTKEEVRIAEERRKFRALDLPTLFPEQGPILILLVGGFADEVALRRFMPFWEDDEGSAHLLWQALAKAGLLHKRDAEFALGRGGFWDPAPPRTIGLAMTYVGFRRKGEIADVDRLLHAWNMHRLQTLVQACHARSMNRLKIVTLGEVARCLMCATVYGMPDIPVLSIAEPTPVVLADRGGVGSPAALWVEWASDLLSIGRS